MKSFLDEIAASFLRWLPSLISALVVLAVGFWLAGLFAKLTEKWMKKTKVDVTLHAFVKACVKVTIQIIVLITSAALLGIPVTSFVAALGAAGISIGLALKDSLSNFASGVLILINKPFKAGDFIEVEGSAGTVTEIQLMFTHLNTPDNKRVVLPNSHMTTSKVINCSAEDQRRLDLVFTISAGSDMEKAKEALESLLNESALVLYEPAPLVAVTNFTANAVDLTCKVWCEAAHYGELRDTLTEQVKAVFDTLGITFPPVQQSVKIQ